MVKPLIIAAAALTIFAAPTAIAQTHHNRADSHDSYRSSHTAQRYDSHGYQQRWNGGHQLRSNWGGQYAYGYDGYAPPRDHHERRRHHRSGHHR